MTTKPRFVQGSIAHHVIEMTSFGAMALIVVSLIDFLDIYFIAQLNQPTMTAGMGFSANINFFVRSMSLALSIAAGALFSRTLGQGETQSAKRLATHCMILAFVLMSTVAFIVYHHREGLLRFLGAKDEALFYAQAHLKWVLCSASTLTVAFCGSQVLRGLGEGGLAMKVSCFGAIAHGLLDLIFIVSLNWGVSGAGIASALSQVCFAVSALYLLHCRFQVIDFSEFSLFFSNVKKILTMALPTLLTNLASPLCSAFAGRQMAEFGDEAMTGYAMVMRFFPLTASVILALSGAVAPIVGQNAGAKLYGRVRLTFYHALWFNWLVMGCITLILFFSRDVFVPLLNLTGLAHELFYLYCSGLSLLVGFDGMLFFMIAGLNNLARPFLGTLANVARVFLGAVPLILIGKYYWGAKGVLLGFLATNCFLSLFLFYFLLGLVKQYELNHV